MSDEATKMDLEFMQLVMGLHGSAWMMLGKVANPMTGKMDKNIDGAKATIDTLMMIQRKTMGNLSKEEEKFLSNTIQQLQLNYVEEARSKPNEPVQKDESKDKE